MNVSEGPQESANEERPKPLTLLFPVSPFPRFPIITSL
jgi:hypothetical protein